MESLGIEIAKQMPGVAASLVIVVIFLRHIRDMSQEARQDAHSRNEGWLSVIKNNTRVLEEVTRMMGRLDRHIQERKQE